MMAVRQLTRSFLALAGVALIAARAVADEGHSEAPLALSLNAAQQIALENNRDIRSSMQEAAQARGQLGTAGEFPNPTISTSVGKINTDGRSNSTAGGNSFWDRSYDSIASLGQLVEIGGKRGARIRSARAALDSADARLADARRVTWLATTRAYVDALNADSNVAILSESAKLLDKEAELAAVRLKSGDISASDKSQIEIAAQRFELDAANARALALSAHLALEQVLGREHPAGDIKLTDSLGFLASEDSPGYSASVDERPDLRALAAMVKKTEEDVALQKALRIPDPTISLQYEHEPPDQPNTIGVAISIPLPLWSHNDGAIASARAAHSQAEVQFQKAREQAVADLQRSSASYSQARAKLKGYRDEIAPKSSKVRETVTYAYRRGSASLVDLLSVERNDNEVRLALAQAMAEAIDARAELEAALNLVP